MQNDVSITWVWKKDQKTNRLIPDKEEGKKERYNGIKSSNEYRNAPSPIQMGSNFLSLYKYKIQPCTESDSEAEEEQ